jgi:hypothetical protein
MNENELELMDGLRALAVAEPREASPRVEQMLLAKFRARAERRRRARLGYSAAAVAAVAAMLAILFWAPGLKSGNGALGRMHAQAPSRQETVIQDEALGTTAPQARFAVVRTEDLSDSFYPLPEAQDLPPLETTMVVRVELPISSLRLMGVPVEEDPGAGPLQADVMLGQDGLARGVRLIQ